MMEFDQKGIIREETAVDIDNESHASSEQGLKGDMTIQEHSDAGSVESTGGYDSDEQLGSRSHSSIESNSSIPKSAVPQTILSPN